MEVVASELFSARVAVSPRPSESDPSKVPTDPSRGRYKAAKDFGAPYGERLCKLVRTMYREANKGLYVVARNFFLLLLNCSAWPCLGPA